MSADTRFAIDVFTLFADRICLSGWLFDSRPVQSLALRGAGLEGGERHLSSYGTLASPDVAKALGRAARKVRFNESFPVAAEFSVSACVLAIRYSDGSEQLLSNLGAPRNQRAAQLAAVFRDQLAERPAGSLLEIGSRARSGLTRRDIAPKDWQYIGLDIAAAHVDRVETHELSACFQTSASTRSWPSPCWNIC